MNFIDEIWEFLKNNVEILVNGAYLILAVILLISRKKLPRSEKLTAIGLILEKLPAIILNAELTFGNKTGETKLIYVLKRCMELCQEKGIEYNEEFWTNQIEKILETPERKKETK